MTNHEFREELIRELQKRMPGAVIFPQDTKKNNGVVFSGIIIRDNSSNVAPNIYTACITTVRTGIRTWKGLLIRFWKCMKK